jgi:hypothetical protein
MLSAGSVFPRRFNSYGPQEVVENFEKNNPLYSKDLSEYVKALISLEFETPHSALSTYLKDIVNGELQTPWNSQVLSNYVRQAVNIELQNRGTHRLLSHICFKLFFFMRKQSSVCFTPCLLIQAPQVCQEVTDILVHLML